MALLDLIIEPADGRWMIQNLSWRETDYFNNIRVAWEVHFGSVTEKVVQMVF